MIKKISMGIFTFWMVFVIHLNASASDPLPSWNEGSAKSAIIKFVQTVTDETNPNYLAPEDRIATFDQDGTLWVEKPLYPQWYFTLDRLKSLTPTLPLTEFDKLLKLLYSKVISATDSLTEQDLAIILGAAHVGITVDEYHAVVDDWLKHAIHQRYNKHYTELIYQPMVEVIQFLQANRFKTYIVSGGGQEFIRVYANKVYNIPTEQIIGSAIKVHYEYRNGHPALVRLPDVMLLNEKEGKPAGINLVIGKKPVAAFGNSDGDRQMLEWAWSNNGAKLSLLVHHDDSAREYAYDKYSLVGALSDSLMKEAHDNGWTVVSMKNDWKYVFPWQVPAIQASP